MFSFDGRELAAVFVGGALGTLARAGLETLAAPDPGRWPWPTFTVNIVGAFLLGYFATRLLERLPVSSYRRPLLGTGLCGGLTTFSTMQVETIKMLEHHHYGLAIGYTAGAVARGITIDDLRIELDGNIDLPVFFGLADGHAGYQRVDARVFLRSDAPVEAIEALHADVVRTSPVGNTLERPAAVHIGLVAVPAA